MSAHSIARGDWKALIVMDSLEASQVMKSLRTQTGPDPLEELEKSPENQAQNFTRRASILPANRRSAGDAAALLRFGQSVYARRPASPIVDRPFLTEFAPTSITTCCRRRLGARLIINQRRDECPSLPGRHKMNRCAFE